jgi:4-hydroxysphinganine ceramide fatty acyl 2-hydroxylase
MTDKMKLRLLVHYQGHSYELTDFASTHPGGDDLLWEWNGKDVTEILHSVNYHSHSDMAIEMLQEYRISPYNDDAPVQTALAPFDLTSSVNRNDEEAQKAAMKSSLPKTAIDEPALSKSDIFLDFKRPIVNQLWQKDLDLKTYLCHVHRAHHLAQPARFFANPFLEMCSRTAWWVIPLLWVRRFHFKLNVFPQKIDSFCHVLLIRALFRFFSFMKAGK